MYVSAFVLRNDVLPINPFTLWGYFLDDLVDRKRVRRANDALLDLADEVWVFGQVADGVVHEVMRARAGGKRVRYFQLGDGSTDIAEVCWRGLDVEEEALERYGAGELERVLGGASEVGALGGR
jgi:hypothetical protein